MNTSPNSNTSAFIDTCIYQGYPETIVDIEYNHTQYLLKEDFIDECICGHCSTCEKNHYLDEIPG